MAERSGVVGGLIAGAGFLVILVVITLLFISTVDDANLLRATESTTTGTDNGVILNTSNPATITGFDLSINRAYAVTGVIVGSDGTVIPSANYTFNSATGTIVNATLTPYSNANITFTYIPFTTYERSVDEMSGNFTQGIGNVSSKIPTVLLLGAIVLLLGVLVVLMRQSEAMGFGGGSSSL